MVRKLSLRFATNRELIRILLFIFKATTSQKVCDVNRSDSAIPPEGCDYSQCPATSTTQCLPVACCS